LPPAKKEERERKRCLGALGVKIRYPLHDCLDDAMPELELVAKGDELVLLHHGLQTAAQLALDAERRRGIVLDDS